MAYRNAYFRIHSRYQPNDGWKNDEDKSEFQQEVRKILGTLGWKIQADKNGGCDSATKGLQDLYFHPQVFSGIISEDEIVVLEDAFLRAQSFQCCQVDIYEEYLELSDDEYRTHLEKQKEDIVKAVLDLCTTKQKNLYRTGSVAEAVAKSFAVNRISDKRRLDSVGISFVHNVIEELISRGHLVTAKTKHGMGLRTVPHKDIPQYNEKNHLDEEQMEFF